MPLALANKESSGGESFMRNYLQSQVTNTMKSSGLSLPPQFSGPSPISSPGYGQQQQQEPSFLVSANSKTANTHERKYSIERNKDQKHETSVMLEELAIKINQERKRNSAMVSNGSSIMQGNTSTRIAPKMVNQSYRSKRSHHQPHVSNF